MTMRDENGYLRGRMPVNAKLLTSMSAVKSHLNGYPNLRLIKRGSELHFLIGGEGEPDKFYIASFGREHVALELFSKISPIYLLPEALLRMLSILSMVSSDYEFDVRSLFPYLIEVIASQNIRYCLERLDTGRLENHSDIILAKRIRSLLESNIRLSKDLESTKLRLSRIAASFIVNRYGSSAGIEEICNGLGMSEKEADSILDFMPEVGYRAIRSNGGKFNLVRI